MPLRTYKARALDKSERQSLYAQFTRRSRPWVMIQVALGTGLRVSELCNLTVGDVYDDIDIRTEFLLTKDRQKGNDDAEISLVSRNDRLRDTLRDWTRDLRKHCGGLVAGDPLFPSSRGTAVSRTIFNRELLWASTAAGIKRVTPHDLRHTFITEVDRASDGDLGLTASLARHKKLDTTRGYIHHDRGQVNDTLTRITL